MRAIDIIKLRVRLGLSQRELAEELGVHQTAVSKWELGGSIGGAAYKALLRLKEETSSKPAA